MNDDCSGRYQAGWEDSILDSPFYTYGEGKFIWLGVITPVGVFAMPFQREDWIDWLRNELEKRHALPPPAVLRNES